jgi:hypothetical protein
LVVVGVRLPCSSNNGHHTRPAPPIKPEALKIGLIPVCPERSRDPDASQHLSTNEHGIARFTGVSPGEQVIAFDDELDWQKALASGSSAATWPVANRAVTFEPEQTERRVTLEHKPAALPD